MLSLSNVASGQGASHYYEAADDYYCTNSPSEWWGQGATYLELRGGIESDVFAALLNGQLPTGEQLHHAAAGRRGGTDATFSAPKSVSLQALVGGDARLIEAHRKAVDRALAYAEKSAACRVTSDGVTRSERTSNLVVARFNHDLSRACSPQLHTHCILINATRRHDQKWRAMDNEPIYHQKMLLGVLYRAELAHEIQALGYQIRLTHNDGRFELAHISDTQVRAFSQRSADIEAYLEQKGLNRDEAPAYLKRLVAVITRQKKTAVDRELLHQDWDALSKKLSIDYVQPTAQINLAPAESAKPILTKAIEHLSEREAVLSHSALVCAALERGVGRVTLTDIEKAIEDSIATEELIKFRDCYTTSSARQLEAEILDFEALWRGTVPSIYQADRATLLSHLEGLSESQRKAVMGILLSRNQVTGIQGRAGVGKTTLLRIAAEIAEASGYTVKGLGPSASAAAELTKGGINAETITAFTHRKAKGLSEQTLLFLDEAGMVSTHQMHSILSAANAVNCRVVLVGDTKQLKAVEAGKPFQQLQKNGMYTSVVDQIQRQKTPRLKRAVELSLDGRVAMAVELLEKNIVQIRNGQDRFAQIARDYAALAPTEREQTRVISGTRYARNSINKCIRDELGLGDQGVEFTTLDRKDLTAEQCRSILSYTVGDVVIAEKKYSSLGMQRGDTATVISRENSRLILELANGMRVQWQPATTSNISVYTPVTRKLAEGDLVRVTANDRARGLINGDLATVLALDKEKLSVTLMLTNGRAVTLDGARPLTLDYGYCSTAHSSQGQTCDRVLIEADSHSLTSSQSTFYVAISRARHFAQIYTDDREMLPQAMSREYEKTSALDLPLVEHRPSYEVEM